MSSTGLPRPTRRSAEGAGPKDAPSARATFVAIDAVGREKDASQLQHPGETQNLERYGFGSLRIAGVRNVTCDAIPASRRVRSVCIPALGPPSAGGRWRQGPGGVVSLSVSGGRVYAYFPASGRVTSLPCRRGCHRPQRCGSGGWPLERGDRVKRRLSRLWGPRWA